MKFTGHERDLGNLGSAADDVDYMHARFYQGQLGRFLRTDPVLQLQRAPSKPQLWNRYSYTVNNPVNFIDAYGEDVSIKITFRGDGWTEKEIEQVIRQVKAFWENLSVGNAYVFDSASETRRTSLPSPGGWHRSPSTQVRPAPLIQT